MSLPKRVLLPTLLSCSASFANAAVDLQITEIWCGNEPGNNLTEDWFEIVNYGDTAWVSGVDAPLFYDDDSRDPTAADPISGISSIQPGEAVIVMVSDEADAIANFLSVWSPVYDLDTVKIGSVDGSGLGQGGDGVSLFLGGPAVESEIDFEAYPDANDFGGQSFSVINQAFSFPGDSPNGSVATAIKNDADQSAVGSPGNLGPVELSANIPVITLLGNNPLVTTLNETFIDPGATAFDEEDGDISGDIIVNGDMVDTTAFGEYLVQYDVTDSDGNAAAPATRDVVVTHEENIPFAPIPANPTMFSHVATLEDLPGAEIPSYDKKSKQAYVTSGDGLQIVDLSNPSNPIMGELIDPSAPPFYLNSSAVTSVDACHGVVAFSVPDQVQTNNGSVVFIKNNGEHIRTVEVGALPDMLTFTSDCRKVLTANEGEPDGGIDPEGSVSIIDVKKGKVKHVDFTRFNGWEAFLQARGVRLFPDVAAANDFEPEYIAISNNDRWAYVTLQEANALAVVDIKRANVLAVLPLGLKDHSVMGNELDASDVDSVVNIQNWPLHGMYMPDAIDSFGKGPFQFYITANEGDARNADERVSDLVLDPTVFPNAEKLQNDFNIGRIQVSSIDGDIDNDGDYDVLQSYGARSFSIWNRWGHLVYDSGSDIESIVNTYGAENADDGRSDNKGPEPEGVEIGKIGHHTYAFIGLERTNQVLVYDVSWPYSPTFVQLLQTEGDEAPEGLKFLSKQESPNRCPSLLVTSEGSNTLSVYQLSHCAN